VPLPANKKPVISVRLVLDSQGALRPLASLFCLDLACSLPQINRDHYHNHHYQPIKSPPTQEVVDEFVFTDPCEAFYRRVAATPPRALPVRSQAFETFGALTPPDQSHPPPTHTH
jgi:hypothetical protein